MKRGLIAKAIVAGCLSALASSAAIAAKPDKPPGASDSIKLIVAGEDLNSPAINDKGEIVYCQGAAPNIVIYSTKRGVIVGPDNNCSNLGISNSGEVVYESDNKPDMERVVSTVRGVIAGIYSASPAISSTTGEIAYLTGMENSGFRQTIATTLQGPFNEFGTYPDYSVSSSGGDVNDYGELVFSVYVEADSTYRIYSTHRGYLTPVGVQALAPSINNSGEVVYMASPDGQTQIFSTVRGQLTTEGGYYPDIDSKGRVVFRGIVNGVQGIYLLEQKGKK